MSYCACSDLSSPPSEVLVRRCSVLCVWNFIAIFLSMGSLSTVLRGGTPAVPLRNKFELNSSQFGIPAAEACRQLCCNAEGCAFWTATDPQPDSTDHLCWLKQGDGQLFPNGCAHYSSGHCWSGAVRGLVRGLVGWFFLFFVFWSVRFACSVRGRKILLLLLLFWPTVQPPRARNRATGHITLKQE